MKFDTQKPHCYYFQEIAKIPHGSGNEKALSDWICGLAAQRGLRFLQDEIWNVVVYVPASPGYEDHPGVIVQAHMDMVCEKTPESAHDFTRDPLQLYVDGTLLRAKDTTLGADDGMGVAYMLDIMTDDQLQHPYLELCFTVQEEVGLVGAKALKAEYFKARRLINLDGGGEVRTYTSLSGSRSMEMEKQLTWTPVSAPVYRCTISGLRGGRLGDDINKERANAWKLAARLLYTFHLHHIPVRIAQLTSRKNSGIPTWAEVVFAAQAEEKTLTELLEQVRREIKEEYEYTDPDISLSLTPADACQAAGEQESLELVELLYLLPFGVQARFLPLDGLPCCSANVGRVETDGALVRINCSVRSPFESYMEEGQAAVALLCRLCGAEITQVSDYYGYRYEKDSPLRSIMDRVYQEQYGQPLQHVAAHGGNECGAFKHLFPDMDIVTSGAIYDDPHTPSETLDLESFDRSIRFLKKFLSEL